MLFLGYLVVVLTVLSISAIATSATVGGGGVYCILGYHGGYTVGWPFIAKLLFFTFTQRGAGYILSTHA